MHILRLQTFFKRHEAEDTRMATGTGSTMLACMPLMLSIDALVHLLYRRTRFPLGLSTHQSARISQHGVQSGHTICGVDLPMRGKGWWLLGARVAGSSSFRLAKFLMQLLSGRCMRLLGMGTHTLPVVCWAGVRGPQGPALVQAVQHACMLYDERHLVCG